MALGLLTAAHAYAATPRLATTQATDPSGVYQQITAEYIAAQWDKLPAEFAKTRDIAAMTKDQQADVTYIKQAMADGRAAWWDAVKKGTKTPIPYRIWFKNINATFDPALTPGQIQMQSNAAGVVAVSMFWQTSDMDSPDQAEHGFTKGDLAYVGIWGALETANLFTTLNQKLAGLSQADKLKFERLEQFRATVAAAYYGTPRARRWAAFLSCDAYLGSHLTAENFIPRRPFAVFLEEEIVSHPTKYPSIRLPRNQKAETVESTLANNLMNQFERTTLTFAEDKALRDAIKDFSLANGTQIFDTGKMTLPSKLPMALDPDQDGNGAVARGQWLIDEIAQPGIHAQAGTKPATAPAGRAATASPTATSQPSRGR